MKIAQFGVQIYSFRDFIKTPADFRRTCASLHAMGYRTIQLSGSICPMPETELASILAETGLVPVSSHDAPAAVLDAPAAAAERLVRLNCFHCAYPFPTVLPADEEETIALAHRLNESARIYRAHGVTLAYHNHQLEFIRFGGRTMLEILYANAPDLEAELDVHWVQRGGGSPVKWIRRMAGRMELIHLKDFGVSGKECVMLPLGQGNLDWDGIFAACEASGVRQYIVEHDGDCADPFASFAASMEFLKKIMSIDRENRI